MASATPARMSSTDTSTERATAIRSAREIGLGATMTCMTASSPAARSRDVADSGYVGGCDSHRPSTEPHRCDRWSGAATHRRGPVPRRCRLDRARLAVVRHPDPRTIAARLPADDAPARISHALHWGAQRRRSS